MISLQIVTLTIQDPLETEQFMLKNPDLFYGPKIRITKQLRTFSF